MKFFCVEFVLSVNVCVQDISLSKLGVPCGLKNFFRAQN